MGGYLFRPAVGSRGRSSPPMSAPLCRPLLPEPPFSILSGPSFLFSSRLPLLSGGLAPLLSAAFSSSATRLPGRGPHTPETALFWTPYPPTQGVRRCEVLNGLGGHSAACAASCTALIGYGPPGTAWGRIWAGDLGPELGFPLPIPPFPPKVLLSASGGMWSW